MQDDNKQGQPAEPGSLETDQNSLEGSSTVVENNGASPTTPSIGETSAGGTPASPPPSEPKRRRLGPSSINLYLLIFILLIIVAVVVSSVLYFRGSSGPASKKLNSQALSTDSLKQLANSDVTVGDSQQVLTVASNAIFNGSVLLRSDVEIAGKLIVGNQLSLTGITVSGQSTFQDVKISNNLAVSKDTAIQGKLTVQGGLSVNGTATFNGLTAGQITANSLLLNSNLNLTHHISAGGGTPSRSSGSALGSGGSASLSGSDTAGSISIHTGSSPGVGCFITVNFTSHFNATPHIAVTPISSSAAGINYYVNRSTSSFSVCTTSTPPSHATFGYDYIAFD